MTIQRSSKSNSLFCFLPAGKVKMAKKKRGAGSCKGTKDEATATRLVGTRERLQLKRLENLVDREAEALTNWAAPPSPPPERQSRVDADGFLHFKRCAHSPLGKKPRPMGVTLFQPCVDAWSPSPGRRGAGRRTGS